MIKKKSRIDTLDQDDGTDQENTLSDSLETIKAVRRLQKRKVEVQGGRVKKKTLSSYISTNHSKIFKTSKQ